MNFIKKSLSSTIILLVFLIAVNVLALQKPLYLDLTEEKIYTISEASKEILRNLDRDINVNLYISKDLPVDLINVKTQVIDFMNQYKDIAGSKIKVSYVEPENTKEKVRELAKKGIPQIQFNVIEKDKYEVKKGFFGMEIASGKEENIKRETIPIIESVDNLEYDFISAVYSVSRDKKETLAFLRGHGEKNFELQDLKKSYEISNVKIAAEGEKKGFYVESNSKKTQNNSEDSGDKEEKTFIDPITLIIGGPTTKISNEEISVIDEYIKNGGNVIILSEMVNPDLNNNLSTQTVDNNVNELTQKYGIKINSDLVYDKSNSNITYRQGFFSISKPYPFWVKVTRDNFGAHPSLSKVQSVILPWTSSLSLNENENYTPRPLFSSTDKAKVASESYDLMPDRQFFFSGGSKKTIAALAEPKDKNSKSGQILVIGDSDFASPNFTGQIPDNKTFFLNLIDSVSNSVNLASIRSKNIVNRPIKNLSESEKNFWKFASVFGMAVLIDSYGGFRIARRRKVYR